MKEQVLTGGKPWKCLVQFAIPLLLGNLFQQFYSMADSFIISRFLGLHAFTGVSSTASLSNMIIGFANGMTIGLAIPLAQRFGAGDEDGVRRHYLVNAGISLGVSVLLTIPALCLTRNLLLLMHTPEDIFSYAREYLQVIFAGIAASVFYNFYANTLRALGDSRSPLHYLLISSAVNILLDLLFVRVIPLGVRGAALATVISQLVAVALCFRQVGRSSRILQADSLRSLRWEGEDVSAPGRLALSNLWVGLPMGFQASLISLGVVLIQGSINTMGTASIAAYAAAHRIDGIAVEPLRSLGTAMSTFTAQNYGAKQYRRIRQGLKECILVSLLLSAFLSLLMIFGGRWLSGLFIGAEEDGILGMSHQWLMIHGFLYGILALLFDFRYTLQGLGNTGIVLQASMMELAARVFSAFLLIPSLGFLGSCIETPLSWLAALLPCLIVWRNTAGKLFL